MTFRESINALSDRALARVVGPVEAGACVIEHGTICGCFPKIDNSCYSLRIPHQGTKYEVSCFGQCNIPILRSCCTL